MIATLSILVGLALGGYVGWSIARASYLHGERWWTCAFYFLVLLQLGLLAGLVVGWLALVGVHCISRFPHC